jgi:acetate kinase
MRIKYVVLIALVGSLFALIGCGPSKQPGPQPMVINGVSVDIPKLQQAFQPAAPEAQNSLTKTVMSIRYGQYAEALAELDKLANTAGITDAQKKVVTDVIEQLKQVMAKAPASPVR